MKSHAMVWLLAAFSTAAACSSPAAGLPPIGDDEDGGTNQTNGVDATAPAADAGSMNVFTDDGGHHDAGSTVTACPNGGHTTISGTVYAPNGTLPLYNVIVFTPVGALQPLSQGASCEMCGALNSAKASATTLSDQEGHFVLTDPPTGKNVPLVVQVGKWRRSVVLPQVTACTDNPLTDPTYTRLPQNTTEGSMPKIAVTTGGADEIACMLPKLGIDASEFGVAGTTAVTLFAGGGGGGPVGIQPAYTLWNSVTTMLKFDMLILSCEGTEDVGTTIPSADAGYTYFSATKDPQSFAAMTQYLGAGGRIFGTDYMYTVWKDSPDTNLSTAATIPGGAPSGGSVVDLDTSFPKGKALADWLAFQYPTQPYGTISLDVVFDNVSSANPATAQIWARGTDSSGAPSQHPRFMTVNTPVGKPVAQQCGKAVHLDAHVNQNDYVDTTYPAGCKSPFSDAEKAFAFFFFDLASCIQVDTEAPKPPPATGSGPQ